MVRIRFLKLNNDLDNCNFRWNLGLLVTCNDICFERYDDNVWISHGVGKSENGENKLVIVYFRMHIRRFSLGCPVCLLRRSCSLKWRQRSKLRLCDIRCISDAFHEFRGQSSSAVQGCWTMERLPLRRKNLHCP